MLIEGSCMVVIAKNGQEVARLVHRQALRRRAISTRREEDHEKDQRPNEEQTRVRECGGSEFDSFAGSRHESKVETIARAGRNSREWLRRSNACGRWRISGCAPGRLIRYKLWFC